MAASNAQQAKGTDRTVRSAVAHLYRRAGFGASAVQLETATEAGYESTVDSLLEGLGNAVDAPGDAVALPPFAPYHRLSAAKGTPQAMAEAKAVRATDRSELTALREWWMGRMIVTATPLREKLTLFWHGHFATSVSKVKDPHLMYLQNELFRTHGAGSFADLVQAVAKDGAMMIWLDTASDAVSHPNENFARECMELFTLGIGSYTQNDVEAAARCFTGWAFDRSTSQWHLRTRQHDDGSKTLLGQSGDLSGEDALSLMVHQPESARFVSARMWSHLAYPVSTEDPVVSDLVAAYGSGLDITALLRAILTHPAFLSPTARAGLVKQPIEYVAGAARSLGLDPATAHLPVLATLLTQAPFEPPNVGGWGQNAYWLDTASSLSRLRVAEYLSVHADISALEAAPPSGRPAATAVLLGLVDGFGPTTTAALSALQDNPRSLLALALNSPEYVLN